MVQRRLLSNLGLSFGSLLVIFVILEAIFKVIAWIQPNQCGPTTIPGLPYENVPNASFRRFDDESGLHLYRHNSFGMRGRQTTQVKPAEVRRVAFLGDSVMHGGNVDQHETTPEVFERLWNEAHPGQPVEALNFGVSSYGLNEYAVMLERKALTFSPDIVVVGMCLNDFVIRTGAEQKGIEKNTKRSWWRERFQNLFRSHFLEFIKGRLAFIRMGRAKPEDFAGVKLGPRDQAQLKEFCAANGIPCLPVMKTVEQYTDESLWRENGTVIKRLVDGAKLTGAKIYFFVYPVSEQVWPGRDTRSPQNVLKGLVEKSGGNYIEMLDVFRDYRAAHPSEKMYPRRDNMHAFANAHREAARKLVEALS